MRATISRRLGIDVKEALARSRHCNTKINKKQTNLKLSDMKEMEIIFTSFNIFTGGKNSNWQLQMCSYRKTQQYCDNSSTTKKTSA